MATENRTLKIEKKFDHPVRLIWEAWIQPEQLIKWWAPPGMPVEVIEHDFRVGGKWKYSMPMPDGSSFISEGTYLQIEECKKIVTSADFRPMTENVELHVEFQEVDGKTLFTFSVIHQTEEYKLQQEKMGFYNGWGSAFTRLAEMLDTK